MAEGLRRATEKGRGCVPGALGDQGCAAGSSCGSLSGAVVAICFDKYCKGEPTLAAAELKARWIFGGHKDPDAGLCPTSSLTASVLGHNDLHELLPTHGGTLPSPPAARAPPRRP